MTYTWLCLTDHRYLIVVDDNKLVFIGSPDASLDEALDYIDGPLVEDELASAAAAQAVVAYLSGTSETIAYPIAPSGTALQQEVWAALQSIPYGQTRTYGEIAAQVGRPRAYQAVGHAIARNPILLAIPCHRVIKKDGSLGSFRGGLAMKAALLQLEQGRAVSF